MNEQGKGGYDVPQQTVTHVEPSIEIDALGFKMTESFLDTWQGWAFLILISVVLLSGLYIWKFGLPKKKAKKG